DLRVMSINALSSLGFCELCTQNCCEVSVDVLIIPVLFPERSVGIPPCRHFVVDTRLRHYITVVLIELFEVVVFLKELVDFVGFFLVFNNRLRHLALTTFFIRLRHT
ncbi:MAG: hypothetical protein ACK55Z_07325, partial [bacterium]